MLEEIFEFIQNLWNLRTLLIVGIIIFICFFIYDRILTTVHHHKEVFGKGGKNDD